MSLSPKILAFIQRAGTAVFNADVALKEAVTDSAKEVSDAMTKNPYEGQHDSLYQNWKDVARISQAMSNIEAELKVLYAQASASPAHTTPVIALPAPVAKGPLEVLSAIDVTDVVAKRTPRKLKGAKKPSKAVAKRAAKVVTNRVKRTGGQDNTTKVLVHLQTILNEQTFTKLNQSSIAVAIAVPKGSIGASIKKLIQDGKLVQGQGKEFKLTTTA
jgi:hypothetical protein